MKLSLPLKLGITVIIIFGAVILGMLLWKPMKISYHISKLHSDDIKVRQAAVKELLHFDREKVLNYYTDRYSSKDVVERMKVVDELCECSEKGKALMKEIFRNWCYIQQVKIPAGALPLRNSRKVEIKSMYVDKYEVCNEKFWVFCKCNNRDMAIWMEDSEKTSGWGRMPTTGSLELIASTVAKYPLHPAEFVSWEAAQEYGDWLGMRLPTEHEWIYAARANSTGKYCFGDNENVLDEYAWCRNNSGGESHPVGRKKPNKWGLYDVHGNVTEWCQDLMDPVDATYIHRGCNYNSTPKSLKSSCREGSNNTPSGGLGFRCVRDIK